MEQDRERVKLLTLPAAGNPDLERRIRLEQRNDLLTERIEERRIAKQVAHLDREVVQELGEHRWFAQDPLLQVRDRRAFEAAQRLLHAATKRSRRVIAEIVLVFEEDRLDEQLELDVEIGRRNGLFLHLGIQTRQSDSSLSRSIGFAR